MIGVRDSSRQTVPLRKVLPSMLTTMSLASGLAAMHFALATDWDRALIAIIVAAVFDVLDGGAARILRASSRFGAVLDSLSDFLSFGIAPAFILHLWMLNDAGVLGLAAIMTFVVCSAMRLARFTSQRRRSSTPAMHMFFVGLPTPAAAGAALVPVMLDASRVLDLRLPELLVVAHVLIVGLLMISRIPFFSIKKVRIRRRAIPLILLGLSLLVVGAAKDPWLTVACLAIVYPLTVPLSIHVARRFKRTATTPASSSASVEAPPALRDAPQENAPGRNGPHPGPPPSA